MRDWIIYAYDTTIWFIQRSLYEMKLASDNQIPRQAHPSHQFDWRWGCLLFNAHESGAALAVTMRYPTVYPSALVLATDTSLDGPLTV